MLFVTAALLTLALEEPVFLDVASLVARERDGEPPATAALLDALRALPAIHPPAWRELPASWSWALGDPGEGLHAPIHRLPHERQPVSLPHRALHPDTPYWYVADITVTTPSALHLRADDGAHVWLDGERIPMTDGVFRLKPTTGPSRLVVRVLNKAVYGGLQGARIASQPDVDRFLRESRLRERLAAAAFAHTAAYDALIARWFAEQIGDERFPPQWLMTLRRKAVLRYGENPHQQAAVYRDVLAHGPNLVEARQLHGKELSYNNLLDLDSALAIVRSFAEPAATVVKHNNPCGAAIAATLAQAAEQALAGDSQSAFGGVMAFNRPVDADTAERLVAQAQFLEALVAPQFEPAAVHVLTTRPRWKQNVRLMEVGSLDRPPATLHLRAIEGGMLVQEADIAPDAPHEWKVVTRTSPDPACWSDLRFAWAVVRHVKSNAIVLARQGTLVGCGAGQMSRVDAVEIAIRKAGSRAAGAVLASDAFFPFPDSIERAAAAGVAAIVQPGGSVRDADVIAAADAHHLPMLFTGRRHFKH